MNPIDIMIRQAEHRSDCQKPRYSARMFYDRSGDGIIVFGCDECYSYTNYQSNKNEIFDILNDLSPKSVSFKQAQLVSKDKLEYRKINAHPILESETD